MAALVCALLLGCQLPTQQPAPAVPPEQERAACDGDLGPARNTQLATIEQQIADGRAYAALAQLDALQANTRKAMWLRADALRRIDRLSEASGLYRQLLDGCMAGRAHHGLGLIAAQTGRWAEAISDLQQARKLQPLDIRVRNDLGYAMLLNRRWDDAQFEFLTALDLAPGDGLASRNLVLMAYMQGKPEVARALLARFKLDAETGERLQTQAAALLKQPLGAWLSAPAAPAPPAPSTAVPTPEAPKNPENAAPAGAEPTVTPLTSPASGA